MIAAALLALLAQDPHVVKKGDLTPVFELEAAFESAETLELRLRWESGGVDASLRSVAAHGAAVKNGDVLLALDGAPLERAIAAAELDLRGAKAALEKARADHELGAKADALALAQAQNALKDAEADLAHFDAVEGPHMLLNAQLSLKSMEDMVADQKEELDQLEKMYKSEELTNATAEIVVRRARRSLERAQTYARIARENHDTVVKLRHPQARRRRAEAVESARTSLAQLQAQQALSAVQRDVERAKAEANVRRQEEQIAKLRRDLASTSVQAPFDGRVFWGAYQNGQWPPVEQTRQMLQPGQTPPPGQALLTLCGNALRVRAELPEKHYFDLEPGAAARVAAVALPGRSTGGVLRTKASAAQSRASGPAFDVRIELEAPAAELLHGMRAKATLTGRTLKDVVVLPAALVKKDGEKSTVKVMADGKAVEREIKTGLGDGKLLHVLEGLSEGEAVAAPKG